MTVETTPGPESGGLEGPMATAFPRLPAAQIEPLERVRDSASAWALLFDWGLIAATITVAHLYFGIWFYPVAVVLIGSRQLALIVLYHEASRRGLFSNPRVNDLVGEVLVAWPIFVSLFSFRTHHEAHHRHLNTMLDPDWPRYRLPDSPVARDWVDPRPLRAVVLPLLKDLFGFDALEQLRKVRRQSRRIDEPDRQEPKAVELPEWRWASYPRWTRITFYLIVAAVLTITGTWLHFLIYWIVPAVTMFKMLMRLRLMSGHFAIYGGDGLRTTLASPLERLLFSPHHIGYHVEHHLYPPVHFSNLPKLHRMLQERDHYAPGTPFRLTYGYWELLRDWTRGEAGQRADERRRFDAAKRNAV